jgi:hypothetical protein
MSAASYGTLSLRATPFRTRERTLPIPLLRRGSDGYWLDVRLQDQRRVGGDEQSDGRAGFPYELDHKLQITIDEGDCGECVADVVSSWNLSRLF